MPALKKPSKIIGQLVELIPATAEHADFLLHLRQLPHKSAFLHQGANSRAEQQAWMEQQDNAGTHIYFIAYDKASGHPIGAVRIYDQQSEHNSVSIGSWVMLDHTPSTLSLETLALAVYYIDFLGFPLCHFAVHPGNRSVLRFHQKLGASIQDAQADSIALINDPKVFLQRLGAHYKLALSSPSILV